jgi:hypothetical protein
MGSKQGAGYHHGYYQGYNIHNPFRGCCNHGGICRIFNKGAAMKLRCSLVVASLVFFSGGALADSNEDVVERVLERLSAAEDTNSPHGMNQFYALCAQELQGYWLFLLDENDNDEADRVYKLVAWYSRMGGDIVRSGEVTYEEQTKISKDTGIFLSISENNATFRKGLFAQCSGYYLKNQ